MIAPGATIGILGGGQLGRMLAIAAAEMGYHAHIYCPEEYSPASEVALHTTVAAYEDETALKAFTQSVDIITYEFENIPAAPLKILGKKLRPGFRVLEICQHRVKEKQAINKLGVATAPFVPVSSQKELAAAVKKIGLPAVLKTARMGYDGKGQHIIRHPGAGRDPYHAFRAMVGMGPGLRRDDVEYILEKFIPFKMEISVIVARGTDGKMQCYPPVQNTHKNHILHDTIAPAPISPALAKKAEAIAKKLAKGLGLVGIMAVEMFVTKDNKLLVNELAPRPHNSGHWTIDACAVSQFEQTIRAICGLPLGPTKLLCKARMLNLIGDDIRQWKKYIAMPNARLHLYGKKDARLGRKMGHVTFLSAL